MEVVARRGLATGALGAALLLGGALVHGNGRVPTTAIVAPDASRVAVQEGGPIHVWERESGRKLCELPSETFFRGSLAKGALAAVGEGGVLLHRGARFEVRRLLALPGVLNVVRTALSSDGERVAALYTAGGSVGDARTARVWDGSTGRVLATVTLRRGRGQGIALSEDGAFLALFGDVPRGGGALLEVYALRGRRAALHLRWESRADETTFSAAFSPRGDRLALGAGRRLLLWDLQQRKLVAEAPAEALKGLFPAALRRLPLRFPGAHQLVFSRDGRSLATLHALGVVGVGEWALPALTPRRWIKRPVTAPPLRQLGWEPGGRLWVVAAGYSPRVELLAAEGDAFVSRRALVP